MKNLFISCLALLIISCSVEQNFENESINQPLNTRSNLIKFNDWNHFNEEYKSITNLNHPELLIWIDNKGHDALLNMNDYSEKKEVDINTLTNGLLAILNEDQEFQVGKNIIYFTDNVFYKVESSDYNDKSNWRGNLKNLEVIGKTNSKSISNNYISKEDQKSITLGTSGITGSNQLEFDRLTYRDCVGGALYGRTCCKLKYVHELVARSFNLGYPNIGTELYIDIKLEYRRRRNRWRAAGEYRNITIDLTGSAVARFSNFNNASPLSIGPWFGSINKTIPCVNRNQNILLADAQYARNIGSPPSWDITINGTITQHVNEDSYQNKWVNYVNW